MVEEAISKRSIKCSKDRHYSTSGKSLAAADVLDGDLNQEGNATILPLRIAINLTRINHMKTLTDCFGREVRVTDERLAHILERPELGGMDSEVELVLRQPQFVRLSRSDYGVRLFYAFYPETLVGGK
jgi:hypothetical protein